MTLLKSDQVAKLSLRQQVKILKLKVQDQNEKIRFLLDNHNLWTDERYTFPDGGTFVKHYDMVN